MIPTGYPKSTFIVLKRISLTSSTRIIEYNPEDGVKKAITPFMDKLRGNLNDIHNKPDKPDTTVGEPDDGWKLLYEADFMSTRQFLSR